LNQPRDIRQRKNSLYLASRATLHPNPQLVRIDWFLRPRFTRASREFFVAAASKFVRAAYQR